MPEQKQFDMLFKSVQFLLYSIQRGLETHWQCILSPMFIPLVATTTTAAAAAVNAVAAVLVWLSSLSSVWSLRWLK